MVKLTPQAVRGYSAVETHLGMVSCRIVPFIRKAYLILT